MTHLAYLQNLHVTVTTVLSYLHDNYLDLIQVYTDGSKTTHRTGSGIYIPEYNTKKTIEINHHSSVLTFELYVILSTLYWLTRCVNIQFSAQIISYPMPAMHQVRPTLHT